MTFYKFYDNGDGDDYGHGDDYNPVGIRDDQIRMTMIGVFKKNIGVLYQLFIEDGRILELGEPRLIENGECIEIEFEGKHPRKKGKTANLSILINMNIFKTYRGDYIISIQLNHEGEYIFKHSYAHTPRTETLVDINCNDIETAPALSARDAIWGTDEEKNDENEDNQFDAIIRSMMYVLEPYRLSVKCPFKNGLEM